MSLDHEYYERQSVLAVTGQLTDAELAELESHAEDCSCCRECLMDMAHVSRELFVAQIGKRKSARAPARLQERFLARAARSGIPIRRSDSTLAELPRFGVAGLVTVLIIFSVMGWRVPSAPKIDRAAITDYLGDGDRPVVGPETRASGSDGLVRNSRRKQRTGVQHKAVLNVGGNLTKELNAPFSVQPILSIDGFTSIHLTAPSSMPTPSFANGDDVAAFFGRKEVDKPEERTFHLDPKLASISFLDFPRNNSAPVSDAPTFHLSRNLIW